MRKQDIWDVQSGFPKQETWSKHWREINGCFSWYFYILQTNIKHSKQNSWFHSTHITISIKLHFFPLSERCHNQLSLSSQTFGASRFLLLHLKTSNPSIIPINSTPKVQSKPNHFCYHQSKSKLSLIWCLN